MKIVKIEVISLRIPHRIVFTIAKGVQGTPENPARRIITRVYTDEGIVGVGESSAIPEWDTATPENVIGALQRYYGPAVIGTDIFDIDEVHRRLDRAIPGGGQPQARCGIDVACYDAMGKAVGLPVHKLLGGSFRSKVDCLYGLGIASPEAMAKLAAERRAAGHRLIKVKIGRDPEADIRRVALVREAIGPEPLLSVDANEGYNRVQARWVAERLPQFNLLCMEQPLPRWDVEGLAQLRRQTGIPIMVDESVYTLPDLLRVIKAEAADYIFVKLDKSGGLRPNLHLITVARAAGIIPIPGAQMNTGVSTTALAHLTVATGMDLPGGFNGPLVLEHDLLKPGSLQYSDGALQVPEGPGLGIELDEDALARYREN